VKIIAKSKGELQHDFGAPRGQRSLLKFLAAGSRAPSDRETMDGTKMNRKWNWQEQELYNVYPALSPFYTQFEKDYTMDAVSASHKLLRACAQSSQQSSWIALKSSAQGSRFCPLFPLLQGITLLRKVSPWFPVTVCTVYLAICYFGSKYMAKQKPYGLKVSALPHHTHFTNT
jgi:hypothetical protein